MRGVRRGGGDVRAGPARNGAVSWQAFYENGFATRLQGGGAVASVVARLCVI